MKNHILNKHLGHLMFFYEKPTFDITHSIFEFFWSNCRVFFSIISSSYYSLLYKDSRKTSIHLRRAIRIVPHVPASVAIRHVAIGQHVLRKRRSGKQGSGKGKRGFRIQKIHKDLIFTEMFRLEYNNG